MANDRINYGYFVDFESVKSMEDLGYHTMLSFLERAGLRPLLTAGKHVYLESLAELFVNARIEGNSIVSSVKGSSVSINEITFQENFSLEPCGLSNIMDVSNEIKEKAWNILTGNFSYVFGSFEKTLLKKEYQVLCDIVAKHIENKSGDFGQVTKTKYCFLAAIVTNTRVNWSSILYHTMEEMVTKRNSNWGFGLVLSRILNNFGLQLENPTPIHAFRILDSRSLIKQRGEGKGRRKGKQIKDGDQIVVEEIESVCKKRKTSVNVEGNFCYQSGNRISFDAGLCDPKLVDCDEVISDNEQLIPRVQKKHKQQVDSQKVGNLTMDSASFQSLLDNNEERGDLSMHLEKIRMLISPPVSDKLDVNREVEACMETVEKQQLLFQQDYEEWKTCRTQLPLSQIQCRMNDLIKIEESLFSISGSQSISKMLEEETYHDIICKLRSKLLYELIEQRESQLMNSIDCDFEIVVVEKLRGILNEMSKKVPMLTETEEPSPQQFHQNTILENLNSYENISSVEGTEIVVNNCSDCNDIFRIDTSTNTDINGTNEVQVEGSIDESVTDGEINNPFLVHSIFDVNRLDDKCENPKISCNPGSMLNEDSMVIPANNSSVVGEKSLLSFESDSFTVCGSDKSVDIAVVTKNNNSDQVMNDFVGKEDVNNDIPTDTLLTDTLLVGKLIDENYTNAKTSSNSGSGLNKGNMNAEDQNPIILETQNLPNSGVHCVSVLISDTMANNNMKTKQAFCEELKKNCLKEKGMNNELHDDSSFLGRTVEDNNGNAKDSANPEIPSNEERRLESSNKSLLCEKNIPVDKEKSSVALMDNAEESITLRVMPVLNRDTTISEVQVQDETNDINIGMQGTNSAVLSDIIIASASEPPINQVVPNVVTENDISMLFQNLTNVFHSCITPLCSSVNANNNRVAKMEEENIVYRTSVEEENENFRKELNYLSTIVSGRMKELSQQIESMERSMMISDRVKQKQFEHLDNQMKEQRKEFSEGMSFVAAQMSELIERFQIFEGNSKASEDKKQTRGRGRRRQTILQMQEGPSN